MPNTAKIQPINGGHDFQMEIIRDAMRSIEPQVTTLFEKHINTSKRWHPHEVLPWGKGIDYRELPWKEGQSPLQPEVVIALETGLLTEDNLPYYHSILESMLEPGGVWQKWNRRWTAEEGVHAATLRDYMYLLRVMDPKLIEQNRLMIMEAGFEREFRNPLEVFAYTALQELATRESHIRTGKKADEPIVFEILSLISRDESFHFAFYQKVVRALLETVPDLMLQAIERQFYTFEMPGASMTEFEMRKETIAQAGIYGPREHLDLVIKPILKLWKLDQLKDLSPEGETSRDKLLKLEGLLERIYKRQERARRKSD